MKGNLNYQASYVARLWRYVALLFCLTLAAPLWAQQSIDFGAYHALVIGNNDYQHLDRLTTGVADARGVARLLREKYGFRVTSLIDADRGQILRALGDMRRDLDEKDNLLIYYAGHGTLDSNTGAGFWQPVDAHPQYDDKWISTDTITRKLNGINAKHVMVVADSCYAGALFERKSASELPTGRERQAWLARMARKGSRTALASGGLEPVMDRGGSGHSVFARVFLGVLEENSEVLDGDRLFDLVKHTVVRKARQTPRYDTIRSLKNEGGDFLFVPKGLQQPLVASAPLPASAYRGQDKELVFLQAARDSGDPAYFREFLRQFPEGALAGLARLELARLEGSGTGSSTGAPSAPDALAGTPLPSVASSDAEKMVMGVSQRRQVQRELTRLGYDTGGADGVFGPRTQQAVRAFQRSRGEAQTGELTRGQWRALVDAASVTPSRPVAASVQEPVRFTGSSKGDTWTEPFSGMEFQWVPGGCFQMGCGPWAGRCDNDEKPVHEVCLDGYWMGRTEVTQGQWEKVMGSNPSYFKKGGNHPVEQVSWEDAQGFVKKLNARGNTGLRLPTEAEWEYACRSGGGEELYAGGDDLKRVGWYDEVSDSGHHPVAKKEANGLGLFDMSGNVWEWTQDWFDKDFYGKSDTRNPISNNRTSDLVLRGGSFVNLAGGSRCAVRLGLAPGNRDGYSGLRLARSPQD